MIFIPRLVESRDLFKRCLIGQTDWHTNIMILQAYRSLQNKENGVICVGFCIVHSIFIIILIFFFFFSFYGLSIVTCSNQGLLLKLWTYLDILLYLIVVFMRTSQLCCRLKHTANTELGTTTNISAFLYFDQNHHLW